MIAGLNAGLSLAAYALLPARWAVTGMAGAYSVALLAGWVLTALVLHRRLTPAVPAAVSVRSASVAAHARLLTAAVPAAFVGHLAAARAMPAGAVAACAAGVAAVGLVFVLLARPLRLTELDHLLTGLTRRLVRRPTRR